MIAMEGFMARTTRFTRLFAILIAGFLSACVAPTTQTPGYDPAEVAREQELQRQMAAGQAKGQVPTISAEEVVARMQRVANRLGPAAEKTCRDMYGTDRPCRFTFVLADKGPVNAWADGSTVTVTPAMVAFTGSDEELAMVLAHEYAHNTLQHPQAMATNTAAGGIAGALVDAIASSRGYDTGNTFSQAGAEYGAYRYSVDFEKEADYVGLYILANAGYDYSKTPEMWRRMTAYDPNGIYGGKTHPSNPDRYIGMNQAIKEINAKKASGAPLLPERKAKKKSRWGF